MFNRGSVVGVTLNHPIKGAATFHASVLSSGDPGIASPRGIRDSRIPSPNINETSRKVPPKGT